MVSQSQPVGKLIEASFLNDRTKINYFQALQARLKKLTI